MLGGGGRFPNPGQKVAPQELRQHQGIHFIRFDFGFRDRPRLQGIGDYNFGHKGLENPYHFPGIGRGFQGQPVGGPEVALPKTLQLFVPTSTLMTLQHGACGINDTKDDKVLMEVTPDIPFLPCRGSGHTSSFFMDVRACMVTHVHRFASSARAMWHVPIRARSSTGVAAGWSDKFTDSQSIR